MSTILTLLLIGIVLSPYMGGAKRKATAAPYAVPDDDEGRAAPFADEDEAELSSAPADMAAAPRTAVSRPQAEAASGVAPVQAAPVAAPAALEGFDLRRAVVWQAVLNNDYINELNNKNQ